MSFLVAPQLAALGVAHGFATRQAGEVGGVCTARQVHGTALARAPAAPPDVRADALWSDAPGTAVGVYTADCVPLLLVSPGRRRVLAIHAGWRGTAAGIVRQVLAELPADDWVAALGPHIGPCCYEVDAPVHRAFAASADTHAFRPGERSGHYQLDLGRANRDQLAAAGVPPERVEQIGGCTACEPERFHSYRRDGSGGRMLHWVRVPT